MLRVANARRTTAKSGPLRDSGRTIMPHRADGRARTPSLAKQITRPPILAKGKTIKGHIWLYVRDDRPFGDSAPPARIYYASRDRGLEHPARRLHGFTGILQTKACRHHRKCPASQRLAKVTTWDSVSLSKARRFFMLHTVEPVDPGLLIEANSAVATKEGRGDALIRFVSHFHNRLIAPWVRFDEIDRCRGNPLSSTSSSGFIGESRLLHEAGPC
jgi:Transposase IS66 family